MEQVNDKKPKELRWIIKTKSVSIGCKEENLDFYINYYNFKEGEYRLESYINK
jgi:hypothetical protein